MERDTVPVIYGLRIAPKEYREACGGFPNVNRNSWGGCVLYEDSPTSEAVLYCKSCRKAEAEWLEAYYRESEDLKSVRVTGQADGLLPET